MEAPHTLHIAPHVVFAANRPRACEVIDVLLIIHVAQATLSEESCPDHIPCSPSHVAEACHFEGVDDTVVGVRAIRNFEARRAVGLQLILCVLDDPVVVTWQVTLLAKEWWVWEENIGVSSDERALDHGYNLVWSSLQKFVSQSILALFVS